MPYTIDWEKAEADFKSNFNDYAPAGRYTVKVKEVEIKTLPTGSIAQEFKFEDSESYAFPKATHWFSKKNMNWTGYHIRKLLELLGVEESAAKKAVETAFAKPDDTKMFDYLLQVYGRAITKAPELEIEVWQDGKYSRADFTNNSVRMSRPDDEKPAQSNGEDVLASGEAVEEDDLPF